MPRADLPQRARVVIVGGGVGGCSIAYHLPRHGERDVLVLERSQLTSGSTFHSAGLVGQLRSSVALTRMMMDSVELYRTLDCGWVECGADGGVHRVVRGAAWAGQQVPAGAADEQQRHGTGDQRGREAT